MTRVPQATRADHDRFCQVEGWQLVRDSRGRSGTHHVTYELSLVDGRILRTRISRPADRTDYGPQLWRHILRDQLDVSEAQFWSCVRDGTVPLRGRPERPAESLPAELVHLLITRVGLTEKEVSGLTKREAAARLEEFWAGG